MTTTEYNKKLAEITDTYELKKKELRREYVASNNPYKRGDIIESKHGVKIQIDTITMGISFGDKYPEAIYSGLVLKKDNTPTKRQETDSIWQSNVNQQSNG